VITDIPSFYLSPTNYRDSEFLYLVVEKYYNLKSEERAQDASEGRSCNPFLVPAFLTVFSIALAIVTAGYMGGFTLMTLECGEISVVDHNCSLDSHGNWKASVVLENVDDEVFILSRVYVNSVEVSSYGSKAPRSAVNSIATDFLKNGRIDRGKCSVVVVWVGSEFNSLASGSIVDIRIQGLDGREYSAMFKLP